MKKERETFIKGLGKELEKYNDHLSEMHKKAKAKGADVGQDFSERMDGFKQKLQEAQGSYEKLKNASEERWEEVKEATSDMFQKLKEGFQEFSGFLSADTLTDMTQQAVDYSQHKLENVESFIKEKPFVATLCALGIGLLFGALYHRWGDS